MKWFVVALIVAFVVAGCISPVSLDPETAILGTWKSDEVNGDGDPLYLTFDGEWVIMRLDPSADGIGMEYQIDGADHLSAYLLGEVFMSVDFVFQTWNVVTMDVTLYGDVETPSLTMRRQAPGTVAE